MASANKDNTFSEEHAQILHGRAKIVQATAKLVGPLKVNIGELNLDPVKLILA